MPRPRVLLLTALGGAALTAALFTSAYLLVDVPDPNKRAISQANTWLYRDGTPIARTGEVNRTVVPLSRISLAAQQATLAAEHRSFYEDPAFSVTGMGRALLANLSGGATQGGSTITQQYVKNYYLTQERTLTRKFRELFIALKVDRSMSKQEVLTGYLNTSYYGRGAYGIDAAARAYYGINAADLDAAQGAYLATLLNAPSRFDVKQSPEYREQALARWNWILDGMVGKGWLPKTERDGMAFPEPKEPQATPGLQGQAGYLVDAARTALVTSGAATEADLAAGGWTIRTTFDKNRQDDLVKAVDTQLRDRLRPEQRNADTGVRAGAASIDNKTGEVIALYGGPDYLKQFVNDAIRRDVQAGSTFKPFALAAALENDAKTSDGRRIRPGTRYDGDDGHKVTRSGYAPGNEGGRSYGSITLRSAMARSVNSVYAQLGEDAGLSAVRDAAVAAGVPAETPDLSATPSLPLGVASPNAVELAGSYATFANHGTHRAPRMIESLEHVGEKRKLPEPKSDRAFDEETADTVTDVLRGVVDDPGGSGSAARALGRPAAGKTGTTNERKSVWFVGYTPQITTSVGVFREDPETHARMPVAGIGGLQHVGGGTYPARIWTAYTKAALKGQPVERFAEVQRDTGGAPAVPSGPTTEPQWDGDSTPPPSPTLPADPSTEAPPNTPTGPALTPDPLDLGTDPSAPSPTPTDPARPWPGRSTPAPGPDDPTLPGDSSGGPGDGQVDETAPPTFRLT
ncbi:transglycosylase domain-containing protein [Streptomyces sp. NPDC090021]|uniref:transglycosylase domain-containing protein n=1 Tax=Streptomyces sp. NPDC090021 TaxID=3365919 RepID=UPI00382D365E